MGLLSKFFGPRKDSLDLPPEVTKIFEKINTFLIDDEAQNASLPESMRRALEASPAVDELPGAKGEFGRCLTNPIPVNGPIGEIAYLSRLATPSGAALFGHRLCHIGKLDVYENVSTDGNTWDVFYLSFYHPRKSHKTPTGYLLPQIGERPAFITCTNLRVHDFPYAMEGAIRECMSRVLGIPVRPQNIADVLDSARFERTPEQMARIAILVAIGIKPAPIFEDAGA